MFKKILYRKIMVATSILLVIMMLYLMPKEDDIKQDINYINTYNKAVIYLLDEANYVSRTTLPVSSNDSITIAYDLIDGLTKNGKKKDIIPTYFKSVLPQGTKVLDISLKDGVLKLDLSKEFNNISPDNEEKVLESLVYTITSIRGIDKLDLYVDGSKFIKLPNSKKEVPELLDKSYGINKKYLMTNLDDIGAITIYYVSNNSQESYYIPVTKYINNKKDDRVRVIIDELTSNLIYESNLASYLDMSTKLLDYEIIDEKIKLNFNDKILSNITDNNILEEVMYSVGLSLCDELNIKEVIFMVNNIEKGVFKE